MRRTFTNKKPIRARKTHGKNVRRKRPSFTKTSSKIKWGARTKTKRTLKKKRGGDNTAVKQLMETNIAEKTFGLEKYLAKICPDSGYCLGFGKETKNISDYFGGFTSLEYLTDISFLSGGKSGAIDVFKMARGKYHVSTIFKTTKNASSDNAFLEAYIGYNYINKQAKFFPCFVETYSVYKFNNDFQGKHTMNNLWSNDGIDIIRSRAQADNSMLGNYLLKSMHSIDIPSENDVAEISKYIKKSCTTPELNAILIQTIDGIPLQHMLDDISIPVFIEILFQIYAPLAALDGEFMQYDLHPSNVLIYTIPDDKYVTVNYHDKDGNITAVMHTQYIAKIIDYGHCYTPLNAQYNKIVHATRLCYKETGDIIDSGHVWHDPILHGNNHYISMIVPNKSHDLRLVKQIIEYNRPDLKNIFNIRYKEIFGTPPLDSMEDDDKNTENTENTENTRKSTRTVPTIRNVMDMYKYLLVLLHNNNESYRQPSVSSDKQTGTLNIYLSRNKEMEYIPTISSV
jgi:hypothetical protein